MKQLERAIRDIAFFDTLSDNATWAYRIDPRITILITAVFIVCVASFPPRSVGALLPYGIYALIMIPGARIPVRSLYRPVGLAVLFALIIGMANPFIDRELVRVGNTEIIGGWLSYASIILRAVFCVSAALILIACTGMARLGYGLARLGVPRIFVSQILFLFRYMFLLSEHTLSVTRARSLRSCGTSLNIGLYGSIVGTLLLRTFDSAEHIYRAMQCRGFNGEIPLPERPRLGIRDIMFFLVWTVMFVLLRVYPGALEHLGTFVLQEIP